MADPKDIGKAFKEKLNDFNQSPSKLIWDDIEPRLPKKERRPVLYWIKRASISALLLSLILFTHEALQDYHTTIDENPLSIDECNEADEHSNRKYVLNNVGTSTKEKKLISPDSKLSPNSTFLDSIKNEQRLSNNENNNTQSPENVSLWKTNGKTNSQVLSRKDTSSLTTQATNPVSHTSKNSTSPTNDQLDMDNSNSKIVNTKNALTIATQRDEDSLNIQSDYEKSAGFINAKPKDTLLYMNPLQEKPFQTFSISLHAAPTYTFALKGSLINDGLSDNTNNGRLSLSYGVLFKANLNKRIVLRFGYNKIKLNRVTKNILVEDLPSTLYNELLLSSPDSQIEGSERIDLEQNLVYNEASIGIQYRITDHKITTSLFGGISLLNNIKNDISINTSSNNFTVNGYDDLRKITFGINLGLNFNYKISKKIFLNTEPLLNYQFQDASKNSKSYQNLFFMIQTGFSYRF